MHLVSHVMEFAFVKANVSMDVLPALFIIATPSLILPDCLSWPFDCHDMEMNQETW